MFHLARFTIRLSMATSLICLAGCAGGEVDVVEEGYLVPGSRADEVYREESTGDYKDLGPNAPGYLGPGGEYQVYPDNDPR